MPPRRRLRPSGAAGVLGALAATCYLPLLLTAPGRVASDTKSYLYLDPARLLSRAAFMWDPHVGMGTVTHQNIGYLFPMGPWFWFAEAVAIPDWVAQRMWLGSILFAAGAGVVALLRDARWPGQAVAVAAFAYALTPYTLTHAGKHSVVLLPFSGLPWLVLFAQRSVRGGGWRAPAAFALVVLAVGGVNATALVLVGVAPLLWLVFAWITGEASAREVLAAAARIGVLSGLNSLWWAAGLWAQGAYGIDVLRFTETAETVADAALSVEVLRSLGYWFFYGRDRLGPWVSASGQYMQSLWVIAATFAVPVLAVAAGALTRWRERSYYVALLAAGVFLAVGAHPWDDPPVGGVAWKAVLQTDSGLALRSTPRAVPLVALALAVLLGGGVAAAARRLPRWSTWVVMAAVILVVAAAMPPLFSGGMIDETLQRDEEVPHYWEELAAHLDGESGRVDGGRSTRVLELPGMDFAAYRWGTTVDPVTPGLIDRPYVAREVVPYGSPASADLLTALDRRVQENVLDPEALVPVARLMGVGTVVARNDIEYERYRTARPYEVRRILDASPGLGPPTAFGVPKTFVEHPTAPLLDELHLAQPAGALTMPPVEARQVSAPVPILRTKPAPQPVVIAGDGEGLVAAAGAGLIDGTELVRYSASMSAGELAELTAGAQLVLTDSNRRRARRWYTVRENAGYTEPVGHTPLVDDPSDNRLDLFESDPSGATQSVAVYRGGVVAQATSYGNPTTLTPEYRPANAVDGDPATVWRTGAGRDVRGESISLSFTSPVTTDHVLVRQLAPSAANRSITAVALVFDGDDDDPVLFDLGSPSQEGGQRLRFTKRTFRRLTVVIKADSSGRTHRLLRPARWFGLDSVGFAEIDVDGRRADEFIRLPVDLPTDGPQPLTILLERLRADPAERVRRDEEPALRRVWSLGRGRTFYLTGSARLSAHAADDVIDELVDPSRAVVAVSSRRLEGDLRRRASAALDASVDTAWMPSFGVADDWIEVRAELPVTIHELSPVVVDAGRHSLPRQIHITSETGATTVELPPAATGPDGLVHHPPVTLPAPLSGTTFRFHFTDVEERTTTEWFSGSPIRVPIAIAELGVPTLTEPAPGPTTRLDERCRPGLVSIDGEDVAIRLSGTVGEALRRGSLPLERCGAEVALGRGEHEAATLSGQASGIDVDRLILTDVAAPAEVPPLGGPTLEIRSRSATAIDIDLTGTGRDPFWLVLGESANRGWALEAEGASAGPRRLVDGFANGWLLTPSGDGPVTARLRWQPQRVIWGALAASACGVLVSVLLLVTGGGGVRPRRREAAAPPMLATRRPDECAAPWTWVAGAALAGAAVTDLVIGPIPGAVIGVAILAGARCPRALLGARLAAPAALALSAAYVLARQIRFRPEPALEWPAELSAVHQLAWTSVALLAAVTVVDRLRRRFHVAGPTAPVARQPTHPRVAGRRGERG